MAKIFESWIHLGILNIFQIDFTLSVFFVVYFFVRFLAAEDKVLMLFKMESIIDFLTLPPVFLSGFFIISSQEIFPRHRTHMTLYVV